MTCRHAKGDPNCGTQFPKPYTPPPAPPLPPTPDDTQYEVVDVLEVGGNLVLKVQYPNCRKCAYEGTKVLVYLGIPMKEAFKWKRINPHFRAPKVKGVVGAVSRMMGSTNNQAPPPDARFPASDDGWENAKAWARSQGQAKEPGA